MADEKNGVDPLQTARNALGEFILERDFADVMAAGLGAIYSLLPSKLRVPSLAAQALSEEGIAASASGGMHLGASGENESGQDEDADMELPMSTDAEVQTQLDLLLKLFGFLQDIVHRCHSPGPRTLDADDGRIGDIQAVGRAISKAALDAVQSSFLANVLYPSILECSSTDGSAVAVLTYFDVIFSNLDDGPLLHRMITFFMDIEISEHPFVAPLSRQDPQRVANARTTVRPAIERAIKYSGNQERFTLKDLILDNIRSSSSAAGTAAFRLLRTLLSDHCQHSVRGLLVTSPDSRAIDSNHHIESKVSCDDDIAEPFLPMLSNPTDTRLQETELYGSLINLVDPSQTSTELAAGYPGYLSDMHAALQGDLCYRQTLIPIHLREGHAEGQAGPFPKDLVRHQLNPSDSLVRALLEALGRFFCQTPDENVALTGAMTALALCPLRSLTGWLLIDPGQDAERWARRRSSVHSDDASSDESIDADVGQAPTADTSNPFIAQSEANLPAVYQILRDLVRQVSRFRHEVDEFDRLLSERRQGLLFADHLDEAMNIMLEVEPSAFGPPITARPPMSPPKKPRHSVVGSLKSFLTPRKKTSTPTSGPITPGSLRDAAGRVSSSPFRSHYEQTSGIAIEAQTSSPIASGPWSPARLSSAPPHARASSGLSRNAMEMASTVGGEEDERGREKADRAEGPKKVTLSTVLDNCVILEEFLKEVVSVIVARRALGIDQVGFL